MRRVFYLCGITEQRIPRNVCISPARWVADDGLLGLGENFESEKGCVMEQKKKRFLLLWLCVSAALLVGSFTAPGGVRTETIQVTMRDAVLHESNKSTCLVFARSIRASFLPWW